MINVQGTGSHTATRFTAYEAPRIESVLTSDELEREVFYAGTSIISCGGGRGNGNNIGGGGNNGVGSGGCDNGGGNGGGNINHL